MANNKTEDKLADAIVSVVCIGIGGLLVLGAGLIILTIIGGLGLALGNPWLWNILTPIGADIGGAGAWFMNYILYIVGTIVGLAIASLLLFSAWTILTPEKAN